MMVLYKQISTGNKKKKKVEKKKKNRERCDGEWWVRNGEAEGFFYVYYTNANVNTFYVMIPTPSPLPSTVCT